MIGQLHLSIENGAAELVPRLVKINSAWGVRHARHAIIVSVTNFCEATRQTQFSLLHKKVSRSFLVPSLALSLLVIKHEDGFLSLSMQLLGIYDRTTFYCLLCLGLSSKINASRTSYSLNAFFEFSIIANDVDVDVNYQSPGISVFFVSTRC
jgi:hypothetical protein